MGAMALAACGEQASEVATQDESAQACQQAQEHLQACFPERAAQSPEGCTAESAEQIMAMNCDQLQAEASADSKADGACNPWYWWLCSGSGGSEPEGYTFALNISVCETPLCTVNLFGEDRSGAECGKITLENERGEVVATDYINDYLASGGVQGTGDGFRDLDLPAGNYVAKLWKRDGTQAVTTKDELAQIDVTLDANGEVTRSASSFEILRTEADLVRACSDVRGSLTSTCSGEQMNDEDTEWGWIIRLDGTNSEGTYMGLKRSRLYYMQDAHSFQFLRVREGDYVISYIEVDVPSWSRELNLTYEEYEELVERYATGNEVVERLEITAQDIEQEDVELVTKALDHQECR